MLVVRAWPTDPPAGRPHVVDGWQRVPVDHYDYRPLCRLAGDVVSMDWDTAISAEDLGAFCDMAGAYRSDVLVAPMRIYRAQPAPWNLAVVDELHGAQRVETGGAAHLFGFGMVYLPGRLLARWDAAHEDGAPMTDQAFASWHHEKVSEQVRVAWHIRPVHLHYPAAGTGRIEDVRTHASA